MIEIPRAFQPYIICRVWEDLKFVPLPSKASVQYIYVNYFWSVHDICDNQGVYPIEYIEADNVFRFYD